MTRWRCTRCGATTTTALPAIAVSCPTCTRNRGGHQQWMHPEPSLTKPSKSS